MARTTTGLRVDLWDEGTGAPAEVATLDLRAFLRGLAGGRRFGSRSGERPAGTPPR